MDSFEQELNDHTEIHIKLQFEECIEKRNQLADETNQNTLNKTKQSSKHEKMNNIRLLLLVVSTRPLIRIN
jgi:hypothetical protein